MKKYKLINNKTKEEIFCKKVEIDGFDYYVNNDKIIDWYYNPKTNTIYYESHPKRLEVINKHKRLKIIATNNPSIDIVQVIDVVEQLAFNKFPEIIKEVWKEEGLAYEEDIHESCREGFVEGYEQSQQNSPFTEQDMIDFSKFIIEQRLRSNVAIKDLLQIFKEQQLKTIFYE